MHLLFSGPTAVVTPGGPGQVNYGYNPNPAAPMAPPSYSAAAASPATYPPPPATSPTAPGKKNNFFLRF